MSSGCTRTQNLPVSSPSDPSEGFGHAGQPASSSRDTSSLNPRSNYNGQQTASAHQDSSKGTMKANAAEDDGSCGLTGMLAEIDLQSREGDNTC
jgi:hypothetical protein